MSSDIHPSLLKRKIIHFDMDAFYASIEVRQDPSLAGKPLVVGGSPQSRGVVCTASYEARKFGIRSAMPCAHAKRLCPEAIFIKPNFELYKQVSQEIRSLFYGYTDLVEPLSLDEAYLDVSANPSGLYATKIAQQLQQAVHAATGLTGSAGVAPNKLLAKIASDLRKPNGISVILPAQAQEFMGKLPLRKIHGVGPATEQRLTAGGLRLCSDVWPLSLGELEERFGSLGIWLHQRSRGIDERAVEPQRTRKSFGRERTFAQDLVDPATLGTVLDDIALSLSQSLASQQTGGHTITLKVKFSDFTQITRRQTSPSVLYRSDELVSLARALLAEAWDQQRPIRLLGVALSGLASLAEPTSGLPLEAHLS